MATPAQTAANRRNAQASTGPITDIGKARTCQNAIRHGLCATFPIMNTEMPEEAQTLLDTLREEHQPLGATEEILVHKMAEHLWSGKRAGHLLAEKIERGELGENNSKDVALMLRYHSTADRGYYKALNELRKVQEARRLQEIGSVSQDTPPSPAPEPPQPENPPVDYEKTIAEAQQILKTFIRKAA